MQRLDNEKGYSLLITLLIIVLFTILGASLMTMTLNGVKKNDSRESLTQAQDLATKGIERIKSQVQQDLIIGIPDSGFSNTLFEKHFNDVISKYLCSDNKIINQSDEGASGNFSTCIDSVKNIASSPESNTRKELVFKSTGFKNNRDSVVYESVEMGADDIQRVLNYTISTLKNQEGGGNLFLHGGSEITGNMNIEGNLFSTNYGYGLGRWAESVFPTVLDSKINLNGKAYTFRSNPETNRDITNINSPHFYNNHIKGDLQSNYSEVLGLKSNENRIFNLNSNITFSKESEVIKPVDTVNEVKKFRIIAEKLPIDNSITNYTNATSFIVKDNKRFENGLTIRNGSNNNTLKSITFEKNIYIKGDLNITDPSNTLKNIRIDGKTIYVEGNVNIQNVNLEANFSVFATGSISIQYVKVSGITQKDGTKKGSLIAFADKNFILSNLSEHLNEPSVINGFFYTNKTMELYGFGSNTMIVGGVAGNNIVLNAMRGYAKEKESEWPRKSTERKCLIFICWNDTIYDYQQIATNYYETRANQKDIFSRLKIVYDEDLLETYRNTIDFTSRLITKDSVFKPIEKDRIYK